MCVLIIKLKQSPEERGLRNTRISVFAVFERVFAKTKTSKREKVQCADYQKSTHHKSNNQSINQHHYQQQQKQFLDTKLYLLLFDNIFSLTLLVGAATYAITQTSRVPNSSNSRAAIRRLLFTHKVPIIVRYLLLNSAAAWYTQHHPLYLFK